jgi:hypothetical protein
MLLIALNSRAHSSSYLIATSGHPLVIRPCLDPKEISVNGHRPVFETSTNSINGRYGSPGREDKTVISRKIHT